MPGYAYLGTESEWSEAYRAFFMHCLSMVFTDLDEIFMEKKQPCCLLQSTCQVRLRFCRPSSRGCMQCCLCSQSSPPGCIFNSHSGLVMPDQLLQLTF